MSLANFGQFIHPSNQVMSHLIVSSYIADSHDSNRVARQSYCDVSKLYIDGRTTRNICVSCSLFVAQITEKQLQHFHLFGCVLILRIHVTAQAAADIHCATWQPFIWLCVRHPLPQDCYMAAIHLTVRETSTAAVLLHGSHSFGCAWDIHCRSTATWQPFIWLCVRHPLPQYCYMAAIHLTVRETSTATVLLHGSHSFDCAWDIHCHSTATWQPFIWLCVRHPLPQYCYMAAIHLTVRETSTAAVLLHGSHSFDCVRHPLPQYCYMAAIHLTVRETSTAAVLLHGSHSFDCAWDIHCRSTATWQPFIWLCVRHPLPQYCYMAAIHLTVRETSTATVLLHGSHSFDCAWDIHCRSIATWQPFIWLYARHPLPQYCYMWAVHLAVFYQFLSDQLYCSTHVLDILWVHLLRRRVIERFCSDASVASGYLRALPRKMWWWLSSGCLPV